MAMLQKKVLKSTAALAVLLAVCLLLTGCSSEPPETSLRDFTESVLKMDSAGLEKFGIKKDMKTEGVKAISEGIRESAGNMLTEADSKAIAEAFVAKFAELQVKEVKTESKSGSEARVSVTLDKVTVKMPEQVPKEVQMRTEQAKSVEDLSAIIRDVLVQVVKEAPKDGTITLTVDCELNKGKHIWLPKDIEKFTSDLLEKAIDTK